MENKLQKESKLLTALSVSALTGRIVKQNEFDDVNVKMLYKLAKFHELHSLAGYAINQNGITLSKEHEALFENAREVCIFRAASQISACELVKQKLSAGKVHFIVLKGMVIRPLYPADDLRTSGDVDILYNDKDICEDELEALMKSAGFEKTKGSKTVDTFTDGKSVFEMHRQLCPDNEINYIPKRMTQLFDGQKLDALYEMTLSIEDFYVFHVSHMARHFLAHGCGIRVLLDTYLLLKEYGDSYDRNILYSSFEETGLSGFEEIIRGLVTSLFRGEELDDLQKEIYRTMMFSGIYGNTKRSAANQRVKSKAGGGGKLRSLTKTAFLPLENMRVKYPVLKKAPFLLPVMWGVRIANVFLHKSDKIKNTVKEYNSVDESEVERTIELYKKLGLSK